MKVCVASTDARYPVLTPQDRGFDVMPEIPTQRGHLFADLAKHVSMSTGWNEDIETG
jgi:hypothetical protein